MIIDGKEIARAFPRRTKATPTDDLALVGIPTKEDLACVEVADEIHVSVTYAGRHARASTPGREKGWARVETCIFLARNANPN